MAKHLKKKASGYKLFSSKSTPAAEAKPAAILDEPVPEPAPKRAAPKAKPGASGRIPDYSPEDAQLPTDDFPDIGRSNNTEPVPELELSDLEYGEIDQNYAVPDTSLEDYSETVPQPEPPEEEPEAEPAPEPQQEPKPEPAEARRPAHRAAPTPRTAPRRPITRREVHRGRYIRRRRAKVIILVLAVLLAAAAVTVIILRGHARSSGSPAAQGYVFSPKAVDSTKPDSYITSTSVMVNDGEVESYKASDALTIDFASGSEYTSAKGILTFRGDNFRSSASYGTADVSTGKFTVNWSTDTGSLKDASGSTWSGSGWTGQPMIVTWPDKTREKMTSMYDWAREKSGLTEVVYPTMDGHIYFTELSTGKATRDPMNLGFTFKGTGTLDPRGYPILYVGSGVNSTAGKSRVFIINLLDCSIMYRLGYYENFATRDWNMWDAAPLVDADTDQLIYPGENGLLYILHLNTLYDEDSGSLTVSPDNLVKWRYDGLRTTTYTYWTGFESSPVCWHGYIFMADNGGNLICLNLNTLKTVWVSDVLDDTSCSPVLSVEDDGVYIYLGGAFHPGWRDKTSAVVPVWKINAVTGEKVWESDYTCTGDGDLSGGVQGTAALGKNSLAGMLFVPIASTPDAKSGTLAALDAKTGKELWRFDTDSYSWSSPVDVYDKDGKGYIVYTTSDGTMYLLDGLTGKQLDQFDLGGTVDASPAVYDGWAVVGTRSQKIWGVKLG